MLLEAQAGPRTSSLLRIATAGSVDDGKSTLIGRLLYDAGVLHDDQLEQVTRTSERRDGVGALDLALLTDGLRAEREQGITIDVAYRYFQTARRKFIVADTPGHVQYTRNMVTGASTADLQLVLVDARHGVVEQSKRHAFIASLLAIRHLVVCVNKMDLVGWEQDVFAAIARDFVAVAGDLGFHDITFFPISALEGDNVVERSARMPWHEGPALLEHLERVEVAADRNFADLRLPVQWVIRPDAAGGGPRRYAGQLAGGVLRPGDEVVVLPAGARTRVAAVESFDGPLEEAFPPMSLSVRLEDELDVSRGDLICRPHDAPPASRELTATVCWLAERPLRAGDRLAIKHTTRSARASVAEVTDRVDIHALRPEPGPAELHLNDIGRVVLRTSAPLFADAYARNRATGSFVLIDEATNDTVGAGMVDAPPIGS